MAPLEAALLLQRLTTDRFPAIWIPSTELRDLRALLLHRHPWVRRRTRVTHASHAIALVGQINSHPCSPKGRDFREQQQLLSRAAADARWLAEIRYQGGATSYLEVLDSDTRMFSAELVVTQAELRELLSLVQIYRSLGGGWQP